MLRGPRPAGPTSATTDLFLARERDDRYAIGNPQDPFASGRTLRAFSLNWPIILPRSGPTGRWPSKFARATWGILTAPGCVVDHVVFLDRKPSGSASVHPYPESRAQEYWVQYAVLGTREVQAAQRRCHQRLLGASLWKMQYSDLGEAVAQLERLARQAFSSPGTHGYFFYFGDLR